MEKTDSFTMYILPGHLDTEQTTQLFKQSLEKMKQLGHDYTRSPFYVKVLNGYSQNKNFGYLRVTDRGLYNCMMGKNPDGSERVKRSDKPLTDYQEYPPFFVKGTEEFVEFDSKSSDMQLKAIADFYKSLGPDYDNKVFEAYEADQTGEVQPSLFEFITHESGCKIDYYPAFVKIDPNRVNFELICKGVPEDFPISEIKTFFTPFNTINKSITRHNEKGVKCIEHYPILNVVFRNKNKKKDILVTFNPRTNDARFAQLVHPRCVLKGTELFFTLPRAEESKTMRQYGSEAAGCLGKPMKAH